MYEFHYKYIEQKYDNSAKFLFTDWDSLVYEIETWCMKIFIKKKIVCLWNWDMMFIKIFIKIKICLILVAILKIQIFLILSIKK